MVLMSTRKVWPAAGGAARKGFLHVLPLRMLCRAKRLSKAGAQAPLRQISRRAHLDYP